MVMQPTGFSSQAMTDLTSLALQAQNARRGIAAPATSANRATPRDTQASEAAGAWGPAVEIDPRTRALAETASSAASATEAASDSDRVFQAQRASSRALRLEMAMNAEESATLARYSLSATRLTIQKFEETGEVWHPDQSGGIMPHPSAESMTYAKRGGPAAYIEDLRGSLDGLQRSIGVHTENAKNLWADYQEFL